MEIKNKKFNTECCLIVCIDSNYGISKKSKIPWNIKEDQFYFLDVTTKEYEIGKQNAVIMGKNTWKDIPSEFRGLKNRINIVISSTLSEEEFNKDNNLKEICILKRNFNDALYICNEFKIGKVFIIGGSQIYIESLTRDLVDIIYLTQINKNYDCDNFIETGKFIKTNNFVCCKEKQFLLTDGNNITSMNKIEVTFSILKKTNKTPIVISNIEENNYLELLYNIITYGNYRQTRNACTWSTFGKNLEFNLKNAFPIITTKVINFRAIFEELLWFLKGDTNAKHLSEKGIIIWNENTSREFLDKCGLNNYEIGDVGPMYGFNWNHFGTEYKGMNFDYNNLGFNQLEYCLNLLKTDPYSRRIIMTTFNPSQAKEGVLYPCHGISIQFYVESDKGNKLLSCMMTQRSSDSFLGLCFNITSYALLVYLFCEVLNNTLDNQDVSSEIIKFIPGKLIINLGDTHVYSDHFSQVVRQILRDPYEFPQLKFKRTVKDLKSFKFDDLELINYKSYAMIKAKMVA